MPHNEDFTSKQLSVSTETIRSLSTSCNAIRISHVNSPNSRRNSQLFDSGERDDCIHIRELIREHVARAGSQPDWRLAACPGNLSWKFHPITLAEATAYSHASTSTHVTERCSRILTGRDGNLSEFLKKLLEKRLFLDIRNQVRTIDMAQECVLTDKI